MPIEFTARDYKEGHWSYRPAEAFPPAALSDPEKYSGEERRYLSITNLRSDDKTLKTIYRLRNLQRLRAAKWWDPDEIEELKRNNPLMEV